MGNSSITEQSALTPVAAWEKPGMLFWHIPWCFKILAIAGNCKAPEWLHMSTDLQGPRHQTAPANHLLVQDHRLSAYAENP